MQTLLTLQAAAAAWDAQLQQASKATTDAMHQQYEALDLQSVEAGDFEPADEIRAAEADDHPIRMHTARCSSDAFVCPWTHLATCSAVLCSICPCSYCIYTSPLPSSLLLSLCSCLGLHRQEAAKAVSNFMQGPELATIGMQLFCLELVAADWDHQHEQLGKVCCAGCSCSRPRPCLVA